jgi:DNA topoisomerase-1
VVTRERERMAFRQAEYWDVEGHFVAAADEKDPTAPRKLTATLHSLDGRRLATGSSFEQTTAAQGRADVVLLDEASARNLAQRLEGAPFSVRSTDEKPYSPQAVRPVHDLDAAAGGRAQAALLAQRVMQTAQRLYENGYITYMRTDSTNLSETAVNAARSRPATSTARSTSRTPRAATPARCKNAQEAHEAIRPSGDVFRTPASWPASCPATSCACTS